MSKATQSAKDKARAAWLKAIGDTRQVARCPICNQMVAIKRLYGHIATCK